MSNNAIVLLSGGQDSTTCLHWAIKQFDEVEAVGFYYGQKHASELMYARGNAARANVGFRVLDLSHILRVDPGSKVTPLRNTLFLTNGAAFAASKGWLNLVIGACASDYKDFIDCRPEFIHSMQQSISLGLGLPFTIHAPLLNLTKAQVWKMGNDLGILDTIIQDTLTDYNGDKTPNEWGMGKLDNDASKTRADGFYQAQSNGWI